MFRFVQIVFAIAFVANVARADLLGQWEFNEGSGTVAHDSSGYGTSADATLTGGASWAAGYTEGLTDEAVYLDGVSGGVSTVYNSKFGTITNNFTLAAWIKLSPQKGGTYQDIIVSDGEWGLWARDSGDITVNSSSTAWIRGGSVRDGKWHHVAGTYDGSYLKLYIDGALVIQAAQSGNVNPNSHTVSIGYSNQYGEFLGGVIDDARVYNNALTQSDIQTLATVPLVPNATNPNPPDYGTGYTSVILSWTPGVGAVQHDVYLGTDPCAVASATHVSAEYKGMISQASYTPNTALQINTTYYWRIDEVGDVNVSKGYVWCFTVNGYPATNPNPPDKGTGYPDTILSWTAGIGAAQHDVYLGTDPCAVASATHLSGLYKGTVLQTSYTPNPALQINTTYYWRVDEVCDLNVCKGCVWSFTTNVPPEQYIHALDVAALNARLATRSEHTRAIVDLIMQDCKPFIIAPDYMGYGQPSSGVNYWKVIMEDAKATAILTSIDGYWPDNQVKQQCLARAKQEFAQVAFAYRDNPSILGWSYGSWIMGDLALGSWFIWDQLDPNVQRAVAQALISNADHYIGTTPPSGYIGDSQSESNAWTSEGMAVATNMMPTHPHSAQWDTAAKKWLYNIVTIPQDSSDNSIGDDGLRVNQWVVGPNLYSDYGLENHNIFAIDYIFDCFTFNLPAAVCYWLAGKSLPMAVTHHQHDLWTNVCTKVSNYEKFMTYVGDNDWKRYHMYSNSPSIAGYIALISQDPLASAFEYEGMQNAVTYWSQMPAGFSYDNPNACGKPQPQQMAIQLLLHIVSPLDTPEPLSNDQVESQLAGTTSLSSVNALMQYSPKGSFRSWYENARQTWPDVKFVTARGMERLLLPINQNLSSGYLNGAIPYNYGRGSNWFWALKYKSGGYEAFVSLPDEVVIFMEYIPAAMHGTTGNLANSITTEKAYFDFAAYYEGGTATYHPDSGWACTDQKSGTSVGGNWINLDDKIGYVVASPTLGTNAGITLPPGSSRGSMRLQSQPNTTSDESVCIVIFPNQSHNDTARMASQTQFTASTSGMSCTIGNISATANFASTNVTFTSESSLYAHDPYPKNGGIASPYKILSWLGAAGASSYIVYLSTDQTAVTNATTSSPEYKGEQTACSYDVVGPLNSGTTYYWRVDAVNGTTVNKGAVWSFTVGNIIADWTFDEGSGSVAHDTSGYGTAADGTINNPGSWVAGHTGAAGDNAYKFSYAAGTYIDCGNDSKFDLTSEITICFWMKEDLSAGATYKDIVTKNTNWYLYSQLGYALTVGDGPDFARATLSDPEGWHFIAGTIDASILRLYIDGTLVATAPRTGGMVPVTDPVRMGGIPPYNEYYNGTLDDVRIYDYALTRAEILNLFGVQYTCTNPPSMDFNQDCKVDFKDFAIFCTQWMQCGRLPIYTCEN